MTYVYNSIIGERGQALVESLVHLVGSALKEAAATCLVSHYLPNDLEGRTTDEECVAGEYSLASAILHVVANTVLCVARRVDGTNADVANLERLGVARRLRHALAVLATDDFDLRVSQLNELYSR